METVYRPAFLRDLKKLKKQKSVYDRVYALTFDTLPEAGSLNELSGVKANERVSRPLPYSPGPISGGRGL